MYGRLADPDSTIGTDPRSDPRMVAALAPLALDGRFPQPALTVDAPLEERLAFVVETEENTGALLDMFAQSVPIVEGVTTTTTTIAGTDGTTSRCTSAVPTPATERCRVWCTCTAGPWLFSAPPTPGTCAGANT
jgi:hypothetical protein